MVIAAGVEITVTLTLDRAYSNAGARFAADGNRYVQGARVANITENSPAAQVDILPGDVILAFDGIRIKDDNHLVNVVGLTEVGRDVSVVLVREGETRTVSVRVGNKREFPHPGRQ